MSSDEATTLVLQLLRDSLPLLLTVFAATSAVTLVVRLLTRWSRPEVL